MSANIESRRIRTQVRSERKIRIIIDNPARAFIQDTIDRIKKQLEANHNHPDTEEARRGLIVVSRNWKGDIDKLNILMGFTAIQKEQPGGIVLKDSLIKIGIKTEADWQEKLLLLTDEESMPEYNIFKYTTPFAKNFLGKTVGFAFSSSALSPNDSEQVLKILEIN